MAKTNNSRRTDMDTLASMCLSCTRCALHEKRTNVVFGQGDPGARVMFVGQGPGAEEDRQGLPFADAAGQLLTSLLHDIGLKRENVFITNIVKCRPPDNRDPRPEEITACNDFLIAQVAVIEPAVLCTLGRHAAISLLGRPDFKISHEHGRATSWKGLRILPMFHPAAAMHQPHLMEPLRKDFLQLEQLLKSKNLH